MTDPSIILDIEPDWSVEPEVTYSFDTAIQPTPYLGEQRRPTRPAAVRTANYKFMDTEEILQRLRYTLLSAKAEQVCVPLFNEPIFASSIVTGGSSITASTDLSYLWNIHNCSYVVLIDINTGQSEMLAVTSVSGQLIRFATNIVQTWVATQTVIYPAMAASLTSLKENGNTDSVGSIDTEFEEIALGAEATGEWVGLNADDCCEESGQVLEFVDYSVGPAGMEFGDFTSAGYGRDTLKLSGLSALYVGGTGANAMVDRLYTPSGSQIIKFDYYHAVDYWYDDDFTDAQCYVMLVPTNFTNTTGNWSYSQPTASTWVRLYVRKLTTSKVSVVTSVDGLIVDQSLTGLLAGLYEKNTYLFLINWDTNTIAIKVNDVDIVLSEGFSSSIKSGLGANYRVIFHLHNYTGAGGPYRYFRNIFV